MGFVRPQDVPIFNHAYGRNRLRPIVDNCRSIPAGILAVDFSPCKNVGGTLWLLSQKPSQSETVTVSTSNSSATEFRGPFHQHVKTDMPANNTPRWRWLLKHSLPEPFIGPTKKHVPTG